MSWKGKLSLPYYAIIVPTEKIAIRRYSRYLSYLKPATTPDGDGELDSLMNDEEGNRITYSQLQGDFMRPKINEVDEVLAKGVNVTIYNGQIDLRVALGSGCVQWRRNHQLNSCLEGFMLLLTSGR
ncbi:hypothetical protein Pint_31721 [Pistacia integerrima]|uniref:Uncharacterized protein n=1 Tax=Pistacia integerrima TaxID=434235 RepID=A0ACC0XN84_9ROSI|nr:hypothetical protein Pint_31721 [Pistacia integerrima]